MNYWLVYNGSITLEKMKVVAYRIFEIAKKKGLKIDLIKNNEIIAYYDNWNRPCIKCMCNCRSPESVIFWDKDIFLAKHLESMGIRLFNSACAIETCDDKSLTTLKLSNSNIFIPKTVISPFVYFHYCFDDNYLSFLEDELGYPFILKEVVGSFGMQVYRIDNRHSFFDVVKNIKNKKIIFQEYIKTSIGCDLRVNIVGRKIIGAMLRENKNDFRANITLGAFAKSYNLTLQQKEVALKIHDIIGLDFSGIDLMFGTNGEPILCEVNSNPNFLSFEEITGIDFCNQIIDYILENEG